jgi:transcription-repair coupling factor (superfamily II helicase)
VGYELYLKLIEQAVAELKGEQPSEVVNPEINVDLPAFFPEDYVSDTDIRLNLYRRLSTLNDKSELEAITEEIRDRFGPPPPEVGNLLGVMSIRLLLKELRVNRLDMGTAGFTLSFAGGNEADAQRLVSLAEDSPHRYRFLSENRLRVLLGGVSREGQIPRIEEAVRSLTGKNPA